VQNGLKLKLISFLCLDNSGEARELYGIWEETRCAESRDVVVVLLMDQEAVEICAKLSDLIDNNIYKEGNTVWVTNPLEKNNLAKNNLIENRLVHPPSELLEQPPRACVTTSCSSLQVPQQLDMSKNSASEKMDTGDGEGSDSSSAKCAAPRFPPEYNTIRAARANGQPTKQLGGNVLASRNDTAKTSHGSFELEGDNRQCTVKNFHIPALKRNASASAHRDKPGDPLLCTACEDRHRLDQNVPVCIFLTDQNFPPSLPVSDGMCACILRIEDALLGEFPDLLSEYFGKGKNCAIAENSVIILGSISHLAQRGLSNYVEELVRAAGNIRAAANKDIYVCHYVYTPLGGVDDPALIRELLDLDTWLNADRTHSATLPDARKKLWETIKGQGLPPDNAAAESRIYYIPENMRNPRKIRTISGSLTTGLPKKIRAFSEEEESGVILALLQEVDANFGVKIGNPSFNRCCATVGTEDSGGSKFVIFGGSHAARIAEQLSKLGANTEVYTRGGWLLNKETATEMCNKIRDLDVGEGGIDDVVVIDLLSNSSFFGTSEDGVPEIAKKDGAGKYHIEGDIMVATPAMARAKLKLLSNLLPSDKNIQYILIAPTPRYISDPCCGSALHCTNFAEKGYRGEILNGLEAIEEVIKNFANDEGIRATVFNPAKVLGISGPSTDFSAAGDLWQPGDPVHLKPECYQRMAEVTAEAALNLETASDNGSLAKRARLECTVVKSREENKNSSVFITPGWSSGMLPQHRQPTPPLRPRGGNRGGWRGRFQRPHGHYSAPRGGRW